MRTRAIIYLFFFFLTASIQARQTLIPPKYEFRGVWIATVNNIDWPRNRFDNTDKQKRDFRVILNQLKSNGINAVVVQVRAAADAFYQSPYEPWSEWLTGKQGKPPVPFYDPLKFMIEEAHKRGMEFHAWLNPYRAVTNTNSSDIHSSHITKLKPHWFLSYGSLKIFNPGLPEVRAYITEIVADIVRRYEVDGIHFDDYFYPYPSNEFKLKDDNTFYTNRNGIKRKADWRRANVDALIRDVHYAIEEINPKVKFGISPYGVWRNSDMTSRGSLTTSGLTSYDHLHADTRLWLEKGWVDYVSPQLYQNTKHKHNSYLELVRWWSKNNFGRHIYVGHAAYRILEKNSSGWNDIKEMPYQVRHLRKYSSVLGSIFYNSKALLSNKGYFTDSLRMDFYRFPSLVPPMPWKDAIAPLAPDSIHVSNNIKNIRLEWDVPIPAQDGELPNKYVVYRFENDEPINIQNPTKIISIQSAKKRYFVDSDVFDANNYSYIVTSLDVLNNESELPFGPPVRTQVSTKTQAIPFDANKPISKNYPFSYEEAEFFYKLMVQSSRDYLGVSE